MNIHFVQVEKKSQLFSHLLMAFAIFTVLMLILSFSRQIELQPSVPSVSMQTVQMATNDAPVAVPAPLPPVTQTQAIATSEPAEGRSAVLAPQVIPAPLPSVP